MKRHLKIQALLTVMMMLVIVAALSVSTYAWFTFSPDVNVEPMKGGVGKSDGNLLISATINGKFDTTCDLLPFEQCVALDPLSTYDLNHFYKATKYNSNEIVTKYENADSSVNSSTIHGRFYMYSTADKTNIYLEKAQLDFGKNAQALASMRLGLKITPKTGDAVTHIFRLDEWISELGITTPYSSKVTVEQNGKVISAVDAGGNASYTADPGKSLNDYSATLNKDGMTFTPGKNSLITIKADEIATVEYWLYLEGCDENCFNAVQNQSVALQLGLCGVVGSN